MVTASVVAQGTIGVVVDITAGVGVDVTADIVAVDIGVDVAVDVMVDMMVIAVNRRRRHVARAVGLHLTSEPKRPLGGRTQQRRDHELASTHGDDDVAAPLELLQMRANKKADRCCR